VTTADEIPNRKPEAVTLTSGRKVLLTRTGNLAESGRDRNASRRANV
jgi:hypothetical protein